MHVLDLITENDASATPMLQAVSRYIDCDPEEVHVALKKIEHAIDTQISLPF